MNYKNPKIFYLLIIVLLSNCSTFKEVHYFSDNTPGIPNYYRLKVRGFSFLSSSRYVSGYYDPSAVDQYFNEIKQPESANLNIQKFSGESVPDSPDLAALNDTTPRLYYPLASQKENAERLVLIFSTSSDAVSNQIGLISQNEATTDALAYLLFDNKFEDNTEVEVKHAVSTNRQKLLIDLGKPLVEDLDTNSVSQVMVYSSLLHYLNSLAMELGNSSPFTNIEEGKEWLEKNRNGILNSTNYRP